MAAAAQSFHDGGTRPAPSNPSRRSHGFPPFIDRMLRRAGRPAPQAGARRGPRSGGGSSSRASLPRRTARRPALPRAGGSSGPADRQARGPRPGRIPRADRYFMPWSAGLKTRWNGTRRRPQPATTASRRVLFALSASASVSMNHAAPAVHGRSRSFTRNDAATIRARLCIQPAATVGASPRRTMGETRFPFPPRREPGRVVPPADGCEPRVQGLPDRLREMGQQMMGELAPSPLPEDRVGAPHHAGGGVRRGACPDRVPYPANTYAPEVQVRGEP